MPGTTVTYTGVAPGSGGAFIYTLVGPANGVDVTAASVGLLAQGCANSFKWGIDKWVNGVDNGSTWPGSITFSNLKKVVVVATAANETGITSTGLGSGNGVTGTGGTSGAGVSGTGAIGVLGAGTAGGNGGQFTGGSSAGIGVYAIGGAGGGYAIDANGHIHLTGSQPAKNADPGDDNLQTPTNIVKAWGSFTISAGVVTLDDGYNVDSITLGAVSMEVTLKRPMYNDTYAPVVNARYATAALASPEVETTATDTFTVIFRVSTSAALVVPNDAGTNINGTFIVCGRQGA